MYNYSKQLSKSNAPEKTVICNLPPRSNWHSSAFQQTPWTNSCSLAQNIGRHTWEPHDPKNTCSTTHGQNRRYQHLGRCAQRCLRMHLEWMPVCGLPTLQKIHDVHESIPQPSQVLLEIFYLLECTIYSISKYIYLFDKYDIFTKSLEGLYSSNIQWIQTSRGSE